MFEKKKSFVFFFRISSGIVSPFGRNCWGSFHKTASFVCREIFGWFCLSKIQLFEFILSMSERKPYFEGKKLAVFSKSHYACIEVFSVIFIQFSVDFEDIRNWAKDFWYDWQKLHSIAPDFCWTTNVFLWKSYFFVSFFCTSGNRFLHNELERFCSLLELASYMSRRKAWKKTFS